MRRNSLAAQNQTQSELTTVTESTVGTVHFVDDGGEVTAQPHQDNARPVSQLEQSVISQFTIKDFLSRPVVVASGTYSTSTTPATILFSNFPESVLTSNAMFKNKWNSNFLLRATAVYRIEFNAMPFQCGWLMFKFMPRPNPSDYLTYMETVRLKSLVQMSQLPGAKFSLEDTNCTIKIPYRSTTEWYELTSSQYSQGWGQVMLIAYTSLRTAATSQQLCDYTIWQSWEDIELAVPTLPQSSMGKHPIVKNSLNVKYLKRKPPTEAETNDGKGPVSSVLSGVTKIANGLGQIPVLSSLMAPVTWYSNLLSGVASSFGWSKPALTDIPHRVILNAHAYEANTNGSDVALPLGLYADSLIKVRNDLGFTDQDESSFAFLVSQWSWGGTFTWTTSQTAGTVLISTVVKPAMADHPVTDTYNLGTMTYNNMSPLSFVSRLFSLWHGSIMIKFRFNKTQYHSGRLQVVFAPGDVAPSGANYESLLREVIDIREGNEVCFTFPYARAIPWLSVRNGDASGIFEMTVLNPLVAAPTVDTTVDIVWEVAGAPDMEFAIPEQTKMYPYYPQMGVDEKDEWYPQMDVSSSDGMTIACNSVGGSFPGPIDDQTQRTIGEAATSLTQLAKRYTQISLVSSLGSAPSVNQGGVLPFWTGGFITTSPSDPFQSSAMLGDYISLFTYLYGFWTGGVRWKFTTDPVASTTVAALQVPAAVNYPTYSGAAFTPGFAGVIPNFTQGYQGHSSVQANLSGGFSVSVPAYMKGRARCVDTSFNRNADTAPAIFESTVGLEWYTMGAGLESHSIAYRAAAEDFQLGMFVCVPPILTGT